MPLPGYYYSTPSLNVSINGINIGEGMQRSDVNNALRQMMADLKVWTDASGVTYPISIANGGTGQTSAAAALAALGGLGTAYQHLPQKVETSTFNIATDADGGHIRYTGAAGTANLVANVTQAFVVGAVVLLVNDGSGALAVTRAAGVTMVWAASGADADRTLAVGGMAMLLQVSINRWFISGAGLT
jgi:hypothetical protein